MTDIEAWLRGLGLEHHAAAFKDHEIDAETLAELTDEDLRELGVRKLGHRKKLLRAIGALAADAALPLRPPSGYTPRHLAERILTSRSAVEGERKQVTVLFADIKGSLDLIQGSDPEHAQAVLDRAIKAMMDAVHRYEGTVNKVLGDGIMALFGAPVAHEDHGARACYAALAMQEAVRLSAEEARRAYGVEAQIRIGLNSGEVVVRAISNDLTMDYDAIGETTHLAGRMEQLALPGTTRLTAATLGLVEGLVQATPLGPIPVKGLDAPIEVFELTGATGTRGRFQAAKARGLTRFVGRRSELETLTQALESARNGHGRIVAVVGEPGVGKSRLFHEFTLSRHTRGWLILESGSVSYGKATAYLPVIDLLKRYFDIDGGDDARRVREKVTGKLLTLDEDLKPTLAPLLALLDAPMEEGEWRTLDPAQRRRRTLGAVKGLLLRESRVQPLVLVFEDLHWIDGETQAFLESLVESLPAANLLLLVNYRPEYRHGWANRTYYSQRRIEPLAAESAEELLGTLLGNDPSVAPLMPLLIERTEGNPFFLEESVRALFESGALTGASGAYRMSGETASVEVPATVQGVLAARIDRLEAENKQLLQTAAVIGKDVPYGLLKSIADLPEEALRRGLADLQSAEFLYETRLYPEPEYTFKHALTHDVAYGSMLRERRRELHKRIADAIQTIYGNRIGEQVERLAHHTTEAGLTDQAVTYWRQAGRRAVERSANAEAISHLTMGLEMLETLPSTAERTRREIELLLALGVPQQSTKGAGSQEVKRTYDRARELCQLAGEPEPLFSALWGLWRYNIACSTMQEGRALASELHDLARREDDSALLLQAHHAQWTTLFALGDFAAAREHTEQGVALYDRRAHRTQAFQIGGHDPCVCAHDHASHIFWLLGYPDQSYACHGQALTLARELDQPSTLASALNTAVQFHQLRGDEEALLANLEALSALSAEQGFAYFLNFGAVLWGWLDIKQKRSDEGQARIEKALSNSIAREWTQGPYATTVAADAYRMAGRTEDGLRLVSHELEKIEANEKHCWEAELIRIQGELLFANSSDRRVEAEARYREAIDLARRQGAKALELRAAMSLARSWAAQGKTDEARDLLAPLFGWFTEGFETADLKEAKGLLDELV